MTKTQNKLAIMLLFCIAAPTANALSAGETTGKESHSGRRAIRDKSTRLSRRPIKRLGDYPISPATQAAIASTRDYDYAGKMRTSAKHTSQNHTRTPSN